MKNILYVLIFSTSFLTVTAQSTSVEKSVFGIQTGFLGFWGHNESKLSNSIVLRSELGFDAGIFSNNFEDGSLFILVPAITIEPRWYYNLNKRVSKSRRIDGNSGNFISIKTTYHPDLVIGSLDDNHNFISDISIIPTWGIRRNVGNHFTYETGIGLGYVHFFKEENVYLKFNNGLALNLHLRIGYRL
ncbi:hypothetical protein [Winogradskyella wichelsiae]|uniref:hypothetical protein n=1 Tax=Winogradskyella wichelsiae TaxID=2697007 RepID=UPI0015C7F894|nr:hypothetical protein [Winogradskyella wichelsiae]